MPKRKRPGKNSRDPNHYSPICECGHRHDEHQVDQGGGVFCIGDLECPCENFTDASEAERRKLAEVLAEGEIAPRRGRHVLTDQPTPQPMGKWA